MELVLTTEMGRVPAFFLPVRGVPSVPSRNVSVTALCLGC